MKLVPVDVDGFQFCVRDLDAGRIVLLVEPCMNFQPCFRFGGSNQADDDLQALERNTLPVSSDVAEQTMLDLVPLARARWVVTHLDHEAGGVRQVLEFQPPQPRPWAIASAAVGHDQQPRALREPLPAELPPPEQDRGDCELGRVVTDSYIHQGFVVLNVIDPVWDGLPKFFFGKVMGLHFDRTFRWPQQPARILQISQHFLLLRVHRDRWLGLLGIAIHAAGDELELGITVGMLLAFDGLAIRLKAVAHLAEQLTDFCTADLKPLPPELSLQASRALDRPSQRRHRITTRARLDQSFDRLLETRLLMLARLSASPRPALAVGGENLRRLQFFDPVLNGRTRQSGRLEHGGDSPPSKRHRFRSGPTTDSAFIKVQENRRVFAMNRFNQCVVWHPRTHPT